MAGTIPIPNPGATVRRAAAVSVAFAFIAGLLFAALGFTPRAHAETVSSVPQTAAVAVSVPQTASVAIVAPAKAISHNLVITNKKHPTKKDRDKYNKPLQLCKDWNYPKGTDKARSCKNSETGTLYNGENSKAKYGWADTDAVYIHKGHKIMISVPGPDQVWVTCNKGDGMYRKMSPPPWTVTIWERKC